MKRLLSITLAAFVAVFSLSAQDTEKKQYLPQQGEWSIGFDAKPVLQLVEAVFSEESDDIMEYPGLGGEPSLSTGPSVSLMGKYMLTDRLALKANVGILVRNNKEGYYVADDAASILDPLSQAKVADFSNTRSTGLSLMAGAEYRVGKKRIQGVFGGGLLFGVEKSLTKYHYGNQMTTINQKPTVAQDHLYDDNAYRVLKQFSYAPDFFVGLVGTAGVEFFVAPKVALGAEMSLTAGYRVYQQTYTVSEGYNPSSEVIEQKTDLITPMYSAFRMATENLGGSLYLSFYF